mgnify:FL=1
MKSEKALGIVLTYILIPALTIILLSTITTSLPAQDNAIMDFNSDWEYFSPASGKSGITDLPAFISVPGNTPLRLVNKIPGPGSGSLSLFFVTRQQKVSVYLDDRLIYDFGPSTSNSVQAPGNSFHIVPLEGSDENSILTIELTSSHAFFSCLVNGFKIGSRDTLMLDLLKKDILPLVVSLLILFLGIILFLLYSMMCMTHVNDSGTFYLSLFSILGGLWLTSERMTMLLFFNDPVLANNVGYISMYLLPVPLLLYIRSICRLKSERMLITLAWVFLGFASLTSILQVFNLINYITALPVFHLLTVISSVHICALFYKETRNGRRPSLIFINSCIALVFFFLLDLALFYVTFYHKTTHLGFFQVSMLLFIVFNIGNLSETLFRIKEMNLENRLLLTLAYTDTLTRLKNRTSFDEAMNSLNSRLREESSIHLVILDVNNLKSINDTFGHQYGDNILKDSAMIMKQTIGRYGDVYRIGGDEFACIIKNKDESVIIESLSRMFELIDEYNSKSEHAKISIAYGTAAYNGELDKDIHSLFVRADRAMYSNKETQKVIQVIG